MLNDNTLSLYHKHTTDEDEIIDDLQLYDLSVDWIDYTQDGGLLGSDAYMNVQYL